MDITIGSINDYFTEIKRIKAILKVHEKNIIKSPFYYRGQDKVFDELKPSIGRLGCSLLDYENEMIFEFKRLKPNEFLNLKNDFDMLAKMQHYGLKTRLLDITENPLVALFFACQNSNKDNGEVFIIYPEIVHDSTDDMTIMFSSFYNLGAVFPRQIEDLINQLEKSLLLRGVRKEGYKTEEIEFYSKQIINNNNEPICVLPSIENEREARQKAAFLLFPNMIDEDSKFLFPQDNKFMSEIINYKKIVSERMGCRLIIDKNKKEYILDELEELGIDISFIYPELEYTAQKINSKFNSNNKESQKFDMR